jgi:ankyrin repeat protein
MHLLSMRLLSSMRTCLWFILWFGRIVWTASDFSEDSDDSLKPLTSGEELLIAATENDLEMVSYLVKNTRSTADSNTHVLNYSSLKSKKTALMIASLYGYTKIVEILLLQPGTNFNAVDNWGETALMKASIMGHREVIKLLLNQQGIAINAADMFGWTALLKAAHSGHSAVVKLFLQVEGIVPFATDKGGRNAFMWACAKGHTNVAKLFLDHRGFEELNSTDNRGMTALMLATLNNRSETVDFLASLDDIAEESK